MTGPIKPNSPAPGGDEALRESLVLAHLDLASYLASRFVNRGEPYEDLCQVAFVGLLLAAARYDSNAGVKFSTFASRTILGEMKRHLRDKVWFIRPTRALQELYLELGPTIELLTHDLNRSPTVKEIAKATNRQESEILMAIEAGFGYRSASLESVVLSDEGFRDGPASEESSNSPSDDFLDDIETSLAILAPLDRDIVRFKYRDNLSQEEIARRLGVSQMHVSRRLRMALEQLRDHFGTRN